MSQSHNSADNPGRASPARLNGFQVLELLERGVEFRVEREGGSRGEEFQTDLDSGSWLFQTYAVDASGAICDNTDGDGSWFSGPEFVRRAIEASRMACAFFYAENLHRRQRRRGGRVPYFSHLMGVSSIALEFGADLDEAVAALLHDSIEDQGGEGLRGQIRRLFGQRVLDIVEGCTEKRTPGLGWKARKLAHVERMRSASPSVALVYASDKLHNLRSMLADFRADGRKMWDKFHAPREEQIWYFRELASVFRSLGYHPRLIGELERALHELQTISA